MLSISFCLRPLSAFAVSAFAASVLAITLSLALRPRSLSISARLLLAFVFCPWAAPIFCSRSRSIGACLLFYSRASLPSTLDRILPSTTTYFYARLTNIRPGIA